MAPLKAVKKDAGEKRLQTITDLATRTLETLKDRLSVPTNLRSELETAVRTLLPLAASQAIAGRSSALDSLGTGIWNTAATAIRANDELEDRLQKELVALLRTFAYLLLDTAHSSLSLRRTDLEQRIRVFKIGLKATRTCLDGGHTDFALKALEGCSRYVGAVEDASPLIRVASDGDASGNDSSNILKRLVCEYYLYRMTLAWRLERVDQANLFYSKLSTTTLAQSGELSERAADLYYEVGRSLQKKGPIEAATAWFERALQTLDTGDASELGQDAEELRLVISGALVGTWLTQQSRELQDRAWELTVGLEKTHGLGNRIAVLLMRLDILLAGDPVNAAEVSGTLTQMIRSAVLTEKLFKVIMQSIHKAKRYDVEVSCQALERLITTRVLPDLDASDEGTRHEEWLEKAVVTYTLFSTARPGRSNDLAYSSLQSIYDDVIRRTNKPLSAKAVHAVQTLIWKMIGPSNQGVADTWCQILQHPLFDSAGLINKARIGRKAIINALASNDIESAHAAFYRMPPSSQNDCMTRYLAYKVALRLSDHQLANESLEVILRQSEKDQKFLYACVLEAQQSNNRALAVSALQAIAEKSPQGANLPALLRCVARLLIAELDHLERPVDEAMPEIIRIFETAAKNTPTFKQNGEEQYKAEVQWWSKNVYNLALRMCAEINPELLVKLLRVCILHLDNYPNDSGAMHHDDLLRRRLLCHFLTTSALIVLGRSPDSPRKNTLQYYLEARKEIATFTTLRQSAESDSAAFKDLTPRAFDLLKFDLECVLKLQDWSQLDPVLDVCMRFAGVDRWDTLADLVIVIHREATSLNVPPSLLAKIPSLLQKIINETYKKDKSLPKVARWVRVTFTLDINASASSSSAASHNDGGSDISLKLLDQAASLARRGSEGKTERYPEDELQWLAKTAFNRGVDMLAMGDGEGFKVWSEAALELARWADDSGSLHANLTGIRKLAEERALKAKDV